MNVTVSLAEKKEEGFPAYGHRVDRAPIRRPVAGIYPLRDFASNQSVDMNNSCMLFQNEEKWRISNLVGAGVSPAVGPITGVGSLPDRTRVGDGIDVENPPREAVDR